MPAVHVELAESSYDVVDAGILGWAGDFINKAGMAARRSWHHWTVAVSSPRCQTVPAGEV